MRADPVMLPVRRPPTVEAALTCQGNVTTLVSHKATEDGSPAAAGSNIMTLPTVLPRKNRNVLLQL